jgi:hypothetical protein
MRRVPRVDVTSRCFVCDLVAEDAFPVARRDGTTYTVPICRRCFEELIRARREPIRSAHELIDIRNSFRRRAEVS